MSSHAQTKDAKWEHSEANDEGKGAEELNWHFCVHGINSEGDGHESGGGTGLDDDALVVCRGQSSNHPSFTSCENHEQNKVKRCGSSEAANDGVHRDDRHDSAE